ncbi:DUF2142 domain-containing protein, partial [Methanobrevibacter sp. OttesenSCG-928-K11]|nr:DUF2142 domain-containing protein [Methanobrevibacter sp. OttesenSCG-928-K11]
FILIYTLFIIFFIFSFFKGDNYLHPKFEIITVFLIFLAGIISILYSFKHKKEIHKIAFVIILIFGILSVFISPTLIACDENEHFARSEMTSSGVLVPEYIEGKGYSVHNLFYQLDNHRGETFLEGNFSSENIDYEKSFYPSGYPQNPFYGYIAQGIGILLAKILDLSVIWAMWLGRLCNLLLYAGICAIGIRKAPVYKIPLLVIACIPMALYQSTSLSIDPFINGFGILIMGYFIYMYKTTSKITLVDVSIFLGSCLLISLIKIPYVLFVFLIFLVNKDKFNSNKTLLFSRIMSIVIILISMCYSYFYASPQLLNTQRAIFFLENNVSASGQINYMLTNPQEAIVTFLQIGNTLPLMVTDIFRFSHMYWTYSSELLSFLYMLFFGVFAIFYPNNVNISKNSRIKLAIIVVLIYLGTFFIQFLTWTSVGSTIIEGVFARYFIPLMALIPLIIGINRHSIKNKNLDLIIITLIISFIAGVLILTIANFY